MTDNPKPIRIINSVAPIRICDNGGWSDTWFAEQGAIFNIGVYPMLKADPGLQVRQGRGGDTRRPR
jgi:D-glycero-alpha-D-manno-heptose-7-phosphate kinase